MSRPPSLPNPSPNAYPSRGDDHPSPKNPRLEDATENAPKPKKKRSSAAAVAASSRTGQACDRCKRRKIRCDGTLGGCMPCRQNNTECKTTDRNTNTARARGHFEMLENHITSSNNHIVELHQQLRDLGHVPRNSVGYPGPQTHAQWKDDQGQIWITTPMQDYNEGQYQASPGLQTDDVSSQAANMFAQPQHSAPAPAVTTFAVAEEDLCAGIGQPLCIFNKTLDLNDFVNQEGDDPRSYSTFVKILRESAGGAQTKYWLDLPSVHECQPLVEAYLWTCNNWQPIVHAPDVMALIDKIYLQNYDPTPAEAVCVRMCLANILYQASCRNLGDPHREAKSQQSDRHYHYAVSLMPELYTSKTLQGVQAMVMICLHLRTLPDHTAANAALAFTFRLAIETKLHRSAKSLPLDERPEGLKTIELRKRVFWTLLTMYVPVCGKLGMPMPLQSEDFDIEPPELLNDDLEPAKGGWAPGSCQFFHAVALMKLSRVFIGLWHTVYAPSRTKDYDAKFREIELMLQNWKQYDWPDVLKGAPEQMEEAPFRVMAAWHKWWSIELEYYLYHPTRLRGPLSSQSLQQALDRSIGLSTDLIQATVVLWRAQALDTTYGNSVSFLGAIFTLLYCLDRRDQAVNTAELDKLEDQLSTCLEIVGNIGAMLKSGPSLVEHVKRVIDEGFGNIKSKHTEKLASAASKPTIRSPMYRSDSQQSGHTPQSATPSNSSRSQNEYAPAPTPTGIYQHRPASATQQRHSQNQLMSPSGGYQQPSTDNVHHYQYDPYAQSTPQYQMSPTDNQAYIFQGNNPQYHQNQVDSSGAWTHYQQEEYMPHMESANALISLSGGGEGPQAQHGQQMAYHMQVPSLMPMQGMQTQQPLDMHWPDNTWGVHDHHGRSD